MTFFNLASNSHNNIKTIFSHICFFFFFYIIDIDINIFLLRCFLIETTQSITHVSHPGKYPKREVMHDSKSD